MHPLESYSAKYVNVMSQVAEFRDPTIRQKIDPLNQTGGGHSRTCTYVLHSAGAILLTLGWDLK